MRSHYNIILFDGSYFLFRNQAVSRDISSNKLAGSVIQSVVKLVRNFDIRFDVGFLAFDRRPYHRTNILRGKYKDSRESFTRQEVADLKSSLDSAPVDEQKSILDRINHMESELNKLKVRNEAIDILRNLKDFGITTLRYPGYEADDLARIIVDLYSDKYSILLLSIDSDWIGLVKDNVDYLRVRHKGITDFYDVDSIKSYPDYVEMRDLGLCELGLARYLEIKESLGIGHNDMRSCVEDQNLPISEIIANWDTLENLVERGFNPDVFRTQLRSFNFKSFPDYPSIKNEILNLRYDLKSINEFNSKFLYELVTGVTSNYYKSLYERICNYSLLQLCR